MNKLKIRFYTIRRDYTIFKLKSMRKKARSRMGFGLDGPRPQTRFWALSDASSTPKMPGNYKQYPTDQSFMTDNELLKFGHTQGLRIALNHLLATGERPVKTQDSRTNRQWGAARGIKVYRVNTYHEDFNKFRNEVVKYENNIFEPWIIKKIRLKKINKLKEKLSIA